MHRSSVAEISLYAELGAKKYFSVICLNICAKNPYCDKKQEAIIEITLKGE